jgi:hypothetical protein
MKSFVVLLALLSVAVAHGRNLIGNVPVVDSCETCKLTVHTIEDYVRAHQTDLCDQFPLSEQSQCEQLATVLLVKLTPDFVCQKANKCPPPNNWLHFG